MLGDLVRLCVISDECGIREELVFGHFLELGVISDEGGTIFLISKEKLVFWGEVCISPDMTSFSRETLGHFGDKCISRGRSRSPKMATASLTERKGREASTVAGLSGVGTAISDNE
uniref:Uncharacterized protein n=1 Tax=Opuntia streptacantha TaxID=393608 RepID=A0A7C9DWJ8_OPUST